MSADDWRHLLTPTAAEIAAASERSRSEAMILSLRRTAEAALYTLREEGFSVEVTKGTMTDGDYIALTACFALEVTKDAPPLSRVALAARLLGFCASFFEHVMAPGEPDHVLHYEIMGAIGYHAGMLTLDEIGLFDIAARAEAAKAARREAVTKRNLERTAWHEPALALARRKRETFPHWPTSRIASIIDNEPSILSPSHTQVLVTLRAWEKDGTLPRRKQAGDK